MTAAGKIAEDARNGLEGIIAAELRRIADPGKERAGDYEVPFTQIAGEHTRVGVTLREWVDGETTVPLRCYLRSVHVRPQGGVEFIDEEGWAHDIGELNIGELAEIAEMIEEYDNN